MKAIGKQRNTQFMPQDFQNTPFSAFSKVRARETAARAGFRKNGTLLRDKPEKEEMGLADFQAQGYICRKAFPSIWTHLGGTSRGHLLRGEFFSPYIPDRAKIKLTARKFLDFLEEQTMPSRKVLFATLAGLAGLLISIIWVPQGWAAEKVFYIMGLEVKGTTSVKKEPFPGKTLPPGDGFEIKAPKNGKWVVESYIFLPSQITVRKGDKVTLNFVGINGAQHLITVERYHPKRISLKRGTMKSVSFTADQAGRFQIKCFEHPPSMTGEIIVLDR